MTPEREKQIRAIPPLPFCNSWFNGDPIKELLAAIDNLRNELHEQAALLISIGKMNAKGHARIEKLREAMEWECSCPGEDNIKCNICEVLAADDEVAK